MISQSCVEQNRTVRVIAKSLFEKSFPPGYKPPPVYMPIQNPLQSCISLGLAIGYMTKINFDCAGLIICTAAAIWKIVLNLSGLNQSSWSNFLSHTCITNISLRIRQPRPSFHDPSEVVLFATFIVIKISQKSRRRRQIHWSAVFINEVYVYVTKFD